ncbi:AmmeMemoRadiSam system protein B [Candidatus Woesearchaeota archaeon]|jgi:hypothetical protein|nr:AmmeMemoRadiSam system protein B [Candidatus Woesearchaeota archaeon]
MNTRKSSVSGTFYSNNSSELENELKYIKESKEKIRATAIIVPHAGYIYSGKTAGEAYKLISPEFEKIIILAPNHTVYTKKAVLDTNDYWETPLGKVKIWKPKINNDAFLENEVVHKQEHAVETHLPFLQVKLKKFEVLPIIIGDINELDLNKIFKEIIKLIDKRTLLIISTDLSHFLTERDAKEVDNETINDILNLRDVNPEYACGANPLKIGNRIFKEINKKPRLLKYTTSAETSNNKNNVVGYASFIIE